MFSSYANLQWLTQRMRMLRASSIERILCDSFWRAGDCSILSTNRSPLRGWSVLAVGSRWMFSNYANLQWLTQRMRMLRASSIERILCDSFWRAGDCSILSTNRSPLWGWSVLAVGSRWMFSSYANLQWLTQRMRMLRASSIERILI
jgi:hypothetical protein